MSFFWTPTELSFAVPIGVVLGAVIAYLASRKNSKDALKAARETLKHQKRQVDIDRRKVASQRVWDKRSDLYIDALNYAQECKSYYRRASSSGLTLDSTQQRGEAQAKVREQLWTLFAYSSREVLDLQNAFILADFAVEAGVVQMLLATNAEQHLQLRQIRLRQPNKPATITVSPELQATIDVASKAADELTKQIRAELLTGDIETDYRGEPRKLHTGLLWKWLGYETERRATE